MTQSTMPTSAHPDATESAPKPRLAIISGPDIASRIRLAKLLATDFEVTVIGSHKGVPASMGDLPYRQYRLERSVNPISDFLALIQLRRLLLSISPQIVQTFSTKPSVLGRLAARQAKVPVIVGTVPGLGSIYGDERLRTRLLRYVYERVQRLACEVSTATVFQNEDDLAAFVRRGLVHRKAAMVIRGSGIDTDTYRPDSLTPAERVELRSSLGIHPGALVVTMVSRVIRSKGVCDFAEAARLLRSDGSSSYHFLLVGEPDLESRDALNKAEWETVQRWVDCLGSRTDVAAILGITDIFVLPSYYREGIPRALLEAAASGKALISTDLPGCREVVQDDSTGVIVPPRDPKSLADAIAALANDPRRRARLGVAARQLAMTQFDLRDVANTMRQLYLELLHHQQLVLGSPKSE